MGALNLQPPDDCLFGRLRNQRLGFNPDCRWETIQEYLALIPSYGIRTSDPHGLNKGCGSKFHVGSRVRQLDEGWRTYWLKCCGYNNKDGDNSPKTLNDEKRLTTVKPQNYCWGQKHGSLNLWRGNCSWFLSGNSNNNILVIDEFKTRRGCPRGVGVSSWCNG